MLTLVDQRIEDYAVAKTEPTGQLLQELVEETYKRTSLPQMLCGPIEGRLLKMLAMLNGARRILEIGMFTGYSALSMAEALPDDGELITCEIDPEVIAIAKSYFDRSEHGKKIKVMQGPALETIKKLQGQFDMAFIDADKENYPNYYEAVMPLLRSGGLMVVDNVLWSGKVLDPREPSDMAIAKLNERAAADERTNRVLLPVRDGMFVIRKK